MTRETGVRPSISAILKTNPELRTKNRGPDLPANAHMPHRIA